MNVEQVRGFCNFDGLYEHYVSEAVGGEVFVELGSLWGRSTIKMAQLIRDSGKDITFYSVDFWDLRGITDGKWSQEDIDWFSRFNIKESQDVCYETMLTTANKCGVLKYIHPIKLSSRVAYKLFDDESIDFIFIDADHSYEGVKEDIQLWTPKVKTGSIIAGHDYDWSGVRKAVDETFSDRQITTYNTSWIVTK